MAVLLIDLPLVLGEMADHLPPSTKLVVGGRSVIEVDVDRPCRLGPRVRGLLLSVVVAQLAQQGCLSFGTTLRECVARRTLPTDIDPDLTVASLLTDIAEPATPTSTSAALLGRVVAAVSGQRVGRVVADIVTEPLGMTATRWEEGWTSTAADLTRLVSSARWAEARVRGGWTPEPGTARSGAADHLTAGLWRNDDLDVSVGYCGDGRALLELLDRLAV